MDAHTGAKKKFNQSLINRKTLVIVFWDQKGVRLVDFMIQATTITRKVYCKPLSPLKKDTKQKKRHGFVWHIDPKANLKDYVNNKVLFSIVYWSGPNPE